MHSIALLQDGKSLIQAARSGETKVDQTNAKKNITKSNLRLYPNPSSGIVYVDARFIGKEISVLNLQGQEVYSANITSTGLDLSQLASGIYSCSIKGDLEVYQGQILIAD